MRSICHTAKKCEKILKIGRFVDIMFKGGNAFIENIVGDKRPLSPAIVGALPKGEPFNNGVPSRQNRTKVVSKKPLRHNYYHNF